MEQIKRISDDAIAPSALAESRLERRDGRSHPGKLRRPVEPVAGAQADFAAGKKTKKAVAVEFDFMQPFLCFGRRINQCRKLDTGILLLQGGQDLLRGSNTLRGFRRLSGL